jgi:hypothetical protein
VSWEIKGVTPSAEEAPADPVDALELPDWSPSPVTADDPPPRMEDSSVFSDSNTPSGVVNVWVWASVVPAVLVAVSE